MPTQPQKLPAPLLYPVLFWCLGIGLAKLVEFPAWVLPALGLLLLLLAAASSRLRPWLALLLCLALGAWRYQASARPSELDTVLQTQNTIRQNTEFMVTQLMSRESGSYRIKIQKIAGLRVKEPVLLFSETELTPGQGYSALLEIRQGKRDPVLDTFEPLHRAYIRQNLTELETGWRWLPVALWRMKLLADLDAKLGPDAEFAKALLFSDTSAKGVYRDQLTRSGMIHLIVVSGLHIWFIYAVSLVLLGLLLPRRLAEACFLVLILCYAALNHWSPSVMRAVLMIGIFTLARWRSIPLASEQLLAFSLLVITAIAPAQLFNIGLQLSYVCVAVLMLGLPWFVGFRDADSPATEPKRLLRQGRDYLIQNVAVSLAVIPLTLYYFGTGSLNSVFGNLIGIPLSGVLLGLGFLVLAVPGGNFVGAAFVNSYRLALRVFEGWTDLVAGLPFYLESSWIGPWQLLGCVLLGLCLFYLLRRWKFQVWVLPPALLGLLLILLPGLNRVPGGIYLFSAGTADCILIRLNDGNSLMVDTGPHYRETDKSWGAGKLLPWLKRKGMGEIDWLVLTHLDSDHSGGFADLARAVKVNNIIVSDETTADPLWESWMDEGLLANSRVHCVTDTVSFQIGGARLKFLHPDRDFFAEGKNDLSLLFRLDYQGLRYLFAGDVETAGEEHLILHYPAELKADYLKAGHHGSNSSSSAEFLRAVAPREVWITVSEGNHWGFPHPEALSNFQRQASSVRSTSRGTIQHSFSQKD